jgi:6-phosphogluconolactonase
MALSPELRMEAAPAELFQAAASEFARLAREAVERSGRFTVALSGGSTPKSLYSLLASDEYSNLPWNRMVFFWGDERHVPPDHPDSNYRMVTEAMLSKVPVPASNIFRVRGETKDADSAARDYEQDICQFFHLRAGEFPRFDLVLLGTGPDGHTASLFPDSAALNESSRLVVANWVEKFKTYRITFTFPVLNHAACVIFLVSGPEKADAVRQVFAAGPEGPPAKRVRPIHGRLLWLVDKAAAGELEGR